MKTLIAALVSIALIAGTANASPSTESNDLVALYTEYAGEAPTAEIAAALADVALPVAVSLDPAQHVGEIWTDCFAFFGGSCSLTDVTGTTSTCQGSVALDWAYYQWIAAPSVVEVGGGSHTTWTEGHVTGGFGGSHSSGTVVGTTCAYNYGFAAYTYTDGVGDFA